MLTNKTQYVRLLRHNASIPERILWQELRNRRLGGYKFHRQFLIDPYIVDFICRQKQFAIEIDGKQHSQQVIYDEERTRFLSRQGIRVLRIPADNVFLKRQEVLDLILASLNDRSPSTFAVVQTPPHGASRALPQAGGE